jgi:hypothetical protein
MTPAEWLRRQRGAGNGVSIQVSEGFAALIAAYDGAVHDARALGVEAPVPQPAPARMAAPAPQRAYAPTTGGASRYVDLAAARRDRGDDCPVCWVRYTHCYCKGSQQ